MKTLSIENMSLLSGSIGSDPLKTLITEWETADENNAVEGFKFAIEAESPQVISNSLFPRLEQKIKLIANPNLFNDGTTYNPDLPIWRTYVEDLIRPGSFLDLNAQYNLPEVDTHSPLTDEELFDTEFFYNYEFLDYENLASFIDEKTIPAHVLFQYEDYVRNNGNFSPNVTQEIRTMGGALTGSSVDPIEFYKTIKNLKSNDSNTYLFDISTDGIDGSEGAAAEPKTFYDNYFKIYTDKRFEDLNSGNPPEMDFSSHSLKNSNIFVLNEDRRAVDTDHLPYYLKINIPPLPGQDTMGGYNGEGGIDSVLSQTRVHRFLFAHLKRSMPDRIDAMLNENGEEFTLQMPTWDLQTWWTGNSMDELVEQEDERFLIDKEDFYLESNSGFFERKLRKVIALASMRAQITQNVKDFDQCVRNKEKNPCSIIGYKIEKRVKSEDLPPFQTIYLPASTESGATFIDNQIGFDRKYYYSISMFALVMGSSYSYSLPQVDLDELTAEFTFVNRPTLRVVEIPLHTSIERAIEPPPPPPNVKIYHEMTKPNKINFHLSDNYGNHVNESVLVEGAHTSSMTSPVNKPYYTILPADEIYKQKMNESSKSNINLYGFSSRASCMKFQIFKLDYKPDSYSDFSEGYLGDIAENLYSNSIDAGGAVTFTDYIAHEQKYYYLFRAVTTRDNPSNPSFIYEVELLEDSDEVILKWDSFQFYEPEVESDYHRTFRKFMRIIPSSRHTMIDTSQFDDHTSAESHILSLGDTDNPDVDNIWAFNSKANGGKYIKLRLTSKQTGKKIDLNLTFNLKDKR